nr:hypothetical protein [Tanacetum cinerariifolium]
MLNKENYVPWSSRLLRYAKSRPNRKLIHNSIINGPYTILLGLPEDIYAAVDSCETAQEIWLRVQQMMKGSDIRIHEKKAKLFNEWEMFTSNEGESIESYYHRFFNLMNDLKQNKHFPEKIASNPKFLNNLQPKWSRHVTIVHQTKDLHTADYTQLYDFLKYNQKEVDELKAERLAKIQDPLALMANSNNPYAFPAPHQDQTSFNQNYMQQPMPNLEDITDPTTALNMALALMAKAFKLNYSTPTNNNQMISSNPPNRQIAQPGMNMGQDRQMQMVGDGSAEVHDYENCDDNEIFNMFTQEEQYTELLEPIPKPHQVPQNDNNVISEVTSMEQSGEKVEQHPANFEETRALYDSLYQNLAIEVEKSREELYFSNDSKTVNVTKSISIPNKEFSDDTTPSVARKFLNEVKGTIVTLQCVVKHRMTLETHNWSSSAHQELYKIVRDENFLIVNQVDARVQNFEIQFLKEAVKFVGDFKSLAKEADESLAKHKALELEIERLLRAVVSQDIMSVVQKEYVVGTSNL